ncbi:hypothetical protein J5N97_004994 [Dioscorea zingiberensis]|uniref:K+ potassium transporter C-terminal domain-containing protein n=1 Tax=Dioscorea zingiberensis TaxID=325984 RepID=A0A9D5D7N0_9LILI|nr:hypothetical protein J5N97_004994 [Dioscorea zingiberensis]
MREKISMDFILELGSSLGTVRVPGIGLVYNELVQGIPSLFGQFLVNLPAIHSTIVFVSIKYVPVPKVSQEERFLFRRVCQKDFHMFRCIARYGYKDVRKEDPRIFEQRLVDSLEKFLRQEAQELALEISSVELIKSGQYVSKFLRPDCPTWNIRTPSSITLGSEVRCCFFYHF